MKKTTFIILTWALVCCGFSHQSYAQVNQANPDSNLSRVTQTQTTSGRSGITTSNYAFSQDNSGLIVPSNWDNVAGTATRLSTPITNQNRVPVTVTHSASQTIGLGSVACGTAGLNGENHYFRDFDLANDFGIAGDFNVTAAEFGVQDATDPVAVTVNIWSSTGGAFPGGTLVLEGTAAYTSTPADLGTVVSVPVTATIPAGAVMVFEFVQADGSIWRIGSNDLGQTGVTWILADACGITSPTDATAIGFPDFHLVMNVVGEEAGGGALVALPVDFELPAGSYDFFGFEGADSVIEDNPDMTGNPSATIMRTTKTAGAQFFAGTVLNLDTPIDFSSTEMVSMKSWSPKDNIPVRMRLENADNSVGIEMDVNTTIMSGWETLTYDFTGMTAGTDFVRVVVFFEFIVDLAGDGSTYYYDDIQIAQTPPPPPTDCNIYASTAVPFDIDGAETQTADCAVAPNLVPVTVTESGLIGTGVNIDNVTVDIAHTWSADLQLTLVSPSGVSLLLANELGGNDDDAYNNTIFMDGGADITMATAPYNAEPFAAEGGAFAAVFAGEEVNGDWQLQLCDGAAGDTGAVLAFSLTICNDAPPPTCMETAATAVPLDIDGAENVTADCAVAPNLVPVTIAESGIIGTDVVLDFAQIDILHTFSADLDLFLVSPLGTELLLSDDNGGGADDGYNMTQFSDGGADITAATAPFGTGPYAAEGGSFAVAFNGEEINGDWQLKVCDDAGGDTGSVQAFSLQFCPPPTCPEVINIVVTPTLTDAAISWDAQAEATNGYIVDVFADGADPMTATPVYNEIIAAGTTMTTATGLMASTSYDLYVTSDCGASGLSSVNPVDFTTSIAPPACGGKFYDTGGPDNDFDNDEAYQVNILPDNPGDLVTATFQLVNTGGGAFDILLVDIGDGVFVQVPEVDVSAGDDPVVYTSIAADGALLFDFFSSGVVPNPGWDADITCDAPPACPSPTGFMVDGITSSSADFSWDAVAEASSGYILRVFNEGDDPTMDTPVADEIIAAGMTSITIMGLMEFTAYDAYLQSDCDTDGTSLEVDLTFSTIGSPAVCNGNYYDTGGPIADYSPGEVTETTILPDNAGDVVTVTFTYVDIESALGAGVQDGCWDFLTVYNGPDTASPVLAMTLCGEESGDGGVPSVPESNLAIGTSFTSTHPSGALTFVFTSDGTVQETGWEADVTCAAPPPCPTPTGINLSNVMAESVDISWSAVAEAINGYRVAVFATGDDPATATPAFAEDTMMLMSTATGLTNNTTYDLYIVSLCDNMVTSGLIPIISFTTDVLGLDDAAVEGFTYFPNPSSDVLNLSATNNIDTVSIYNLLGQLVLSQEVNATSSQLNISKFSTGSYIMKVTSNGVTGSYKVIKR